MDDWKVIGEYVYDKDGGRHQAFVAPKKDVTVRGVHIEKGERVHIEQSLKYSETDSQTLWAAAGLKEVGKWKATKDQYSKYLQHLLLVKVQTCCDFIRSLCRSIQYRRVLVAFFLLCGML